MIFVTQPSLAPLEEYTQLLAGVWERGILTHNGPLVQQLERDPAVQARVLGQKHRRLTAAAELGDHFGGGRG